MLHSFKKIKKNICRYHYQYVDDMIYSSWDIAQNILKLVILGLFLSFYPPKNPPKSKFWKMKKFAGDNTILHVYQKIAIWCTFSEVRSETNRNFCHFGLFFALSASDNLENQNFKIEKKHFDILSFYPFAPYMSIIWSYDIWS